MTKEEEKALHERLAEVKQKLKAYLIDYEVEALVTSVQSKNAWWLCNARSIKKYKGRQFVLLYEGKLYMAKNYAEGAHLVYSYASKKMFTTKKTDVSTDSVILARRDYFAKKPIWTVNKDFGEQYENLLLALDSDDYLFIADDYRPNMVMLSNKLTGEVVLVNDEGKNVMRRK
jgi:hypothetical protein